VYFANQTATVRHLFCHVMKVVPLLLVVRAIAASERLLRQLKTLFWRTMTQKQFIHPPRLHCHRDQTGNAIYQYQ